MASTTNHTMISTDESNLEAIKNQIISNLRVTRPDVKNPIITTAVHRNDHWIASVWDDENTVIYTTFVGVDSAVAAMRALLHLISTDVFVKLEEWKSDVMRRAVGLH